MSTSVKQKTYFNYINGEWVKASTGEVIPIQNPADKEEAAGYVQRSSLEDVNGAITCSS